MSTMNRFPSGGGSSDIATAKSNNVLKGYTFIGKDSDDIQTGTLELTGSAVKNHVIKGAVFYNKDAKTKVTGTMEVGNVSNLNLAVSSGRNITITWSNPAQTIGRPYSGVYIKYSTSGNPGTGGTQIYKGTGNNTTSGGRSSVILGFPNLGTRYYISVYSYCVTSNGELIGTPIQGNIVSGSTYTQTITSSKNITVPSGYSKVDIFCVGGGGGGNRGDTDSSGSPGGGGGGGGYTTTVNNINVTVGQILNCVVGGGGSGNVTTYGTSGGNSYVSSNNIILCNANGGSAGINIRFGGNNGGSGGGSGAVSSGGGGDGGSNGSNGIGQYVGTGQGYTTTAFAENIGTIYSGGGGGGGYGAGDRYANKWGGSGGNYGGGAGGTGQWNAGSSSEPEWTIPTDGSSGTANSGGGGGGGGSAYLDRVGYSRYGGNGGSGIILIRFK